MMYINFTPQVSLVRHEAVLRELEETRYERDVAVAQAEDWKRLGAIEQGNAQRNSATITRLQEQLAEKDEQLSQVERMLLETRRQLMVRETETQAFHSLPLWTYKNRRFVRLHPGDNPIDEHDPFIARMCQQLARNMAEELYRVAHRPDAEPAARVLIARSAIEPVPAPAYPTGQPMTLQGTSASTATPNPYGWPADFNEREGEG